MPNLNEAREEHLSCILENTLYVIGRYNDSQGTLNSIEKLVGISGPALPSFSRWESIQLDLS